MTWDEINQKFPEDQYSMDLERNRDFIQACFEAYETEGFSDRFWTPFDFVSDEIKNHVGQHFRVIGRCQEGEQYDLNSLPAWYIEFEDGFRADAYPEEICPHDMAANGFVPDKT